MSRKEILISTVLLILFGTGMHFVHHLPFFNHFWGYIFPVQESVMAHMKMVLYPMLLLSLYLVIRERDIHEFGAPILAGLTVMPLIVAVFFSYWVFVHHEIMALDIVIYVASIVGAVWLALRWRKSHFVRKCWPLWILVFILAAVLTGYLTYHGPDWIIFANLG